MKAVITLPLLLAPFSGDAATLRFGTNEVLPGRPTHFFTPPNAKARWEAARSQLKVDWVAGAFVVPNGFDLAKAWPLLIVSVPSGSSSIASLKQYTNVALTEGWVALAIDGPRLKPEQDTIEWGWAMLASGLEHLSRTWPQTKQWPVACAGFSGGAKRSAAVAAAMTKDNFRVIGVFMGGCNEDRVTLGQQLFQPGPQFKNVPLFLSNGTADPIANPKHGAAVKASMERSGFNRIRLEAYNSGHRLDQEHLRAALIWFRELTKR